MPAVSEKDVLVPSILDTDLYKLTMQQAVLKHFPTSQARYKFTNRSKNTTFSRACFELFQSNVSKFTDIFLSSEEREWLERTCIYFSPSYLDYLTSYRFQPSEQVEIRFVPKSDTDPDRGQIEIEVSGPWVEAILYEVPLMSTLSEAYFRTVDTDWNYDGQEELAYQKGCQFLRHGVVLSEFGARRRRSLNSQRLVIEGLVRARDELQGKEGIDGQIRGTSNVHLARLYGLVPVGTIAHEWTMAIAALRGYENPNTISLSLWEDVYPDGPGNNMYIALTDTYTSDVFFREFIADPERAARWKGLRQDSGDPVAFAKRAQEVYEQLGIDPSTKAIVFSDSLDLETVLDIRKKTKELGFQSSFGVGTSLTNDYRSVSSGEKSKALNMVIKLAAIDGRHCIKLSDDLGKNTGDPQTVLDVKKRFGLPV